MIIAVRLSAIAKNVPQRIRGGHKFTHEALAADVTKKEYEEIKADQYLKICNFPSVGWFEAMGIDRTEKNELLHREGGKEDGEYLPPKELPENANGAERMGGKAPAPSKGGKTSPDATGEGVEGTKTKGKTEKVKELSASSDVEDIVKALVARGKVAGTDFEENAKPEVLFAYLQSL